MKEVIINGKWPIMLPDHRAARPEWYTENGWERKRLDSMHEHLGADDTMFYVGAEEGDMAGLLASWNVKIGLFEPNERVWSNIKAIWEANNLPKPLFCFAGFASDCQVNAQLGMNYEFPASANGPLISDHGFKELADPGEIPQIRIDEIQFPCTAMSIDVEGSEWHVLRGAEELLKKHHPKLWVSVHPEFMEHYFKENSGDMRKWIRDLGYEETLLDYQHEAHFLYIKKEPEMET